jgi:hypothetical protein
MSTRGCERNCDFDFVIYLLTRYVLCLLRAILSKVPARDGEAHLQIGKYRVPG